MSSALKEALADNPYSGTCTLFVAQFDEKRPDVVKTHLVGNSGYMILRPNADGKYDLEFKSEEQYDKNGEPNYIVKEIYKNQLFNVKFEGQTSETMRQETGIRQGCPLSPYLFTIVMSVLFWDVKKERELSRKLRENRVPGASFDEVLYADDTILISTDTRAINEFLKEIETQGENIGMTLNKENSNNNRKEQKCKYQV